MERVHWVVDAFVLRECVLRISPCINVKIMYRVGFQKAYLLYSVLCVLG